MKRIAFVILALLAFRAEAQTNVCIGASCNVGAANFTSTAQNDADGLLAKLIDNAALCLVKGAAGGANCSQAQLNAVQGCAAGACGTIYALTGTGTAQYAMDRMTSCYFTVLAGKIQSAQVNAAAGLMITNGAIVASNAQCSGAVGGLPNGCTLGQIACRALSNGASTICVVSQ